VVDALHGVDLDVGSLVTGEVGVGQDQQSLRAIGDIEGAVEAKLLDAALFASGFIKSVGQRDVVVIELIRDMRRKNGDRERNGRLNLYAQFLAVVVWGHQAINFGHLRDIVFFVHDPPPVKLGQDAVVYAIPREVLDAEVVGRNKLADAGPENGSDGRDDRLFRLALIVESDDHRALGRQMTFVNRADDVLPDTHESEVHRSVGVLHRVVPLIGPRHGDGHGIVGFDLDVHVPAAGSRAVRPPGMEAGWFHGDGFVVGWSPVEDAVVLAECKCGAGAEQRGEYKEGSHHHKYWRGPVRDLANSQGFGYGGT
jgi:hypothetical protein